MILTILLGGLFAGIVFFHYVQGFFSSTISAILAIFAAVLAFSYHESIAESLLAGAAANVAHSLVLVALFAVIYLGLRTLFDKMVPNGIMLPAAVDRVGGAVMGVVAAIFALGILAIAIEELPMGSNVVGYTKYDTENNQRNVLQGRMNQEYTNFDELKSTDAGAFDDKQRMQLFPVVIPGVDEIVVGTVARLSETGSMQGTPLSQIHPDFLQEIYGQNIGIQGGAKHVMLPANASVAGVFRVGEVNVVDSELSNVRGGRSPLLALNIKPHTDPVHPSQTIQTFGVDDSHMLVVVRISFTADAADSDKLIRLSPGSMRLVARSKDDVYHDYYAIGTIEPGKPGSSIPTLFSNKPDDYLVVDLPRNGNAAIDAAFLVEKDGFEKTVVNEEQHSKRPVTKDGMFIVAEDAFIEIKRMFRESLKDQSIKLYPNSQVAGLTIGAMHPADVVKAAKVIPAKGPKIGSVELTFNERSKFSEMKSLCKNLNYTQAPADYDLSNERFLAYVPPKYDPTKPMGLIVLLNPRKTDALPETLFPEFDAGNTALIVARNAPDPWWQRAGLALDAVYNMQQQYAVNGNRIYLYGGGSSGGALLFLEERLGLAYPQVFSGMVLTEYGTFTPVTTTDNQTIPAAFPSPPQESLKDAKQLPIIILDTEKRPVDKIFLDYLRALDFTQTETMVVGKETLSPGSAPGWIAQSLQFLDERTSTFRRPASAPPAAK